MVNVTRRGAIRVAGLALCLLVFVAPAGAGPGNYNGPDLEDCPELKVEAGNKLVLQARGLGVQIYRWNGTSWVFVAPEAVLFSGGREVAIHFAGPTWESNSGSRVVGAVIDHCSPDPDSIPWLLLGAVPAPSEGPGVFNGVTFIQRLNTVGGLAPAIPGTIVGEVASVPYAADYLFYKKQR